MWLEYAKTPADVTRQTSLSEENDPHPAVKVLLTPWREANCGLIAAELRTRMKSERAKPEWIRFGHSAERRARVIYTQTTVSAELYFEDLIRIALPMTEWWNQQAKAHVFDELTT